MSRGLNEVAADAPERVSLMMVIASIAAVWITYFIIFTMRGWVIGLDLQGEMMLRRAVVCAVGAVTTLLMWQILRLFDEKPLTYKVPAAILLAVPTAILIAQANHMVFAPIQDRLAAKLAQDRGFTLRRDEAGNMIIETPGSGEGQFDDSPPAGTRAAGRVVLPRETSRDQWLQLIELALSQYFLLLTWAALYFALLAGAQAKMAERREGEFRRAAKAAELRSLRYQVNPHFLFNTLNSLSALVMTGKSDQAEEMIQALSSFYRHSLADDPTTDVPLREEFNLQRHYLEVESARFPSRLRTRFELPDELAERMIPGMILQPLVENSVKYAVAARSEPTTIALTAWAEADRLVVRVSDNGRSGRSGEKPAGRTDAPPSNGLGIGLTNVRDRLAARFGDRASIVSGPSLDGYETEIRLPLNDHA